MHLANQRAVEAKALMIELSSQANLCAASFVAPCGNGILQGAEQCDDGNLQDGDGCDSTCQIAVCGNGLVEGAETCDDANTIGDDGCEQCKTKTSQNTIYVAGGLDFYKYSITSNQWTTKPALPTLRGSTLTNDAASVYYADRTNDHKIYKFDGTSWSLASIPAVTAATDSDIPGGNQDPRDLLVWFDDGFYYVNAYKLNADVNSRYELWVYRTSTGQWTLKASGLAHHNNSAGQSDPQPNGQFESAQWDRASQRLYLKFNQGGFAVVDTTAGSLTQDSIVQWRHDDPHNYTIGDQGSAFAFSRGMLYRWSPNTLRRYTEQSGSWGYTTVTTTPGWGSDGAGSWNSSYLRGDTDPADGAVYVFTGFKFKRLDPSSNTLAPLTNGNISAPDITVMRPL